MLQTHFDKDTFVDMFMDFVDSDKHDYFICPRGVVEVKNTKHPTRAIFVVRVGDTSLLSDLSGTSPIKGRIYQQPTVVNDLDAQLTFTMVIFLRFWNPNDIPSDFWVQLGFDDHKAAMFTDFIQIIGDAPGQIPYDTYKEISEFYDTYLSGIHQPQFYSEEVRKPEGGWQPDTYYLEEATKAELDELHRLTMQMAESCLVISEREI